MAAALLQQQCAQECAARTGGQPQKKMFDRRVRVYSAARESSNRGLTTRHPTPSPRRRRTASTKHNLTRRSPQKPVVPQLHDHGHLAVELDALEGDSSPMSFQRVIPPTSGSFLESVGDRRPVVLVLELFR